MKRIAFVIATLNVGGAERVVSNIVTHLPEEYEADIILNDTHDIAYPYKGNLISLGMKPKKNKIAVWYQLKVLIKRVLLLRKLKKNRKYLAVMSFSESANVANILSGNNHGKVIVSVRSNLTQCGRIKAYKYIVTPLVKILYNRADALIAVGKGVAFDLVKNYGIKESFITTICNGCDCNMIRQQMEEALDDKEKKWFDAENILVTTGRVDYPKGQWHLIRALSELKKKKVDFKLLIMGKGPLEEYLRTLTRELGMEQNIVFCGYMEKPFKILARADIFILSSIFEGLPNALLEAMCCGIPCVSADFDSGAREILAPDTRIDYKNKNEIEFAEYGVIVPVCDGIQYSAADQLTKEECMLSEAIEKLLEDKKLYSDYKSKVAQYAQQLDIEEIVGKWIKVFDS